ILVTIDLDFLAGVLAEQDGVAGLHVQRNAFAVVFRLAVAGGDDFALLGLFLGAVGDDDAADFLLTLLDALNNDAVVQRSDVHALLRWRKKGDSIGAPAGAMPTRRVSTRYVRLLIIVEALAVSMVDC